MSCDVIYSKFVRVPLVM